MTARFEDDLPALIAAGDEAALATCIGQLYPQMLRFAKAMVDTDAVAQDVVQETWISVIEGIDSFAGRASFTTWLFAILKNKANKQIGSDIRRRNRERHDLDEYDEPLAGRLHPDGHPDAGHWSSPPSVRLLPESQAVTAELRAELRLAVDALPARQRQVVTLRDIVGLGSSEVQELLGLEAGNQRTLLHRARATLRAQMEHYQMETD